MVNKSIVFFLLTLHFNSLVFNENNHSSSQVESYRLQLLNVKNENLKQACITVLNNLEDCVGHEIGRSREVLTLRAGLLDMDYNSLESRVIFYFQKDFFISSDRKYQGVIKIDSGYIFVPIGDNNFWIEYTDEYVDISLDTEYDEDASSGKEQGCVYLLKKEGKFETPLECSCN